MSSFEPKQLSASDINQGEKYRNKVDSPQAEAFNRLVEAILFAQENGLKITVDDALSDTSENPVKNKVITEALEGKVDKEQYLQEIIDKVSYEDLENNYYNKAQTDEAILNAEESINEDIKVITNALTQGGVMAETEISQAYTERITANGENIVDEQQTLVSKIQGSSVASKNLFQFTPFSAVTNDNINITLDENGVLTAVGDGNGEVVQYRIATFVAPKDGTYYYKAIFEKNATGNSFCILRDNNEIHNVDIMEEGSFTATAGQGFTIIFEAYNIPISENESGAPTDCIAKIMINEGESPLPYEPPINGLKNSYFKGVESYGRNLFDISKITGLESSSGKNESQYLTITEDGRINVRYGAYGAGVFFVGNEVYLKSGTYTISFDINTNNLNTAMYFGVYKKYTNKHITSSTGTVLPYTSHHIAKQITIADDGLYNFRIQPSGNAGNYTNITAEVYNFQFEYGRVEHPYMPYTEDKSFMLNSGIELGEYDYIDVERQKVVRQTGTLTQATAFTEEELTNYGEYKISSDGKTIVYRLDAKTETDIVIPQTYKAWVNGQEKCIQGDTDNSDYGAKPIITQDYFKIIGG